MTIFFRGSDLAHAFDHHRNGDPPERVALAARKNRERKFLRLGRREDKHRVRRRLFQRLEKRVGALFGKHVRLVDDVHFHAHRRRREFYRVAQRANFIDAAIAGRIDFQHVERGAG